MAERVGAGALCAAGQPAEHRHVGVGMGWGWGSPLGQTRPSMGLALGVLVSICVFKTEDKMRPGSRKGKKKPMR